jgi:Undecaprenyl-phosphate glucose phosphotransferase
MDGIQTAVLERGTLVSPPVPQSPAGGRLSPQVFLALVRGADISMMLVAGAAMLLLPALLRAHPGSPGHWEPGNGAGGACLAVIVATCVAGWGLWRLDVYKVPRLRALGRQIGSLMPSLPGGALAAAACLMLLGRARPDAVAGALAWMIVAFCLLGGSRVILSLVLASPAVAQRLARRIVVFGANPLSHRFIERLHAERGSTDRVTAVFDERRSRIPEYHAGVPVLGQIDDLLHLCRKEPVDVIVLALPLSATSRLSEVFETLKPTVSDIYVTVDLAGERAELAELGSLGPNPVVAISRQPLDDMAAFKKRTLDLFAGVLLLIMVAPVMGLIALAIRMDSEGPVLFRQTRRGLNNNDFTVFKFRTMYHHLSDTTGQRQAVRNDPRVTRVGWLLRRLSFDELPQIFNVLRGDMSLVGPRPHALNTRAGDRLLEDAVSDYAMRHRVKPGITGWAQVNGFRGAIRTEAQLRKRVEHDLYYINNWSLWFDIKIMFMTLNAKRHTRNAF